MRASLFAICCLTVIPLVPRDVTAHEPRTPAAESDRIAQYAPSVRCGESGDCAASEPRSVAYRTRTLFAPPPEIREAITAASETTGTDIVYLIRTAMLEGSYDPVCEASTSTAAGLYQFIEQTWLYMMREHGHEFGLWDFAEAVTYSEENGFDVEDKLLRAHILSLRYDPKLSALFAAAFTRRNADTMARALGRAAEPAELYLAHVLGASGAAALIRLAGERPKANASKAFPAAARANRAIFFQRRKPRSAKEVLNVLLNKYFEVPADTGAARLWRPGGSGRPAPVRYLGGYELVHASR